MTTKSILSTNENFAAIPEAAMRIGNTDLFDVVLRIKAFEETFADVENNSIRKKE
jgi:hypothetical protein